MSENRKLNIIAVRILITEGVKIAEILIVNNVIMCGRPHIKYSSYSIGTLSIIELEEQTTNYKNLHWP